jgi:hypothetical protein
LSTFSASAKTWRNFDARTMREAADMVAAASRRRGLGGEVGLRVQERSGKGE